MQIKDQMCLQWGRGANVVIIKVQSSAPASCSEFLAPLYQSRTLYKKSNKRLIRARGNVVGDKGKKRKKLVSQA